MVLRHSASHPRAQANGWVDAGRVAAVVGQAGSDVDDGAAQGGCACNGAAITGQGCRAAQHQRGRRGSKNPA